MSMNNFSLRHATLNDIPSLLPLMSELGYPSTADDLKARFIKFLKNARYGVVVCEMKGEIAGFVSWSTSDLFISNKVRFHIESLVVAKKYRRRSVGKKLMRFVESIAIKHTPVIVDFTSGLRRESDGSHEFYRRLGYHNEGPMAKVYFRKEL